MTYIDTSVLVAYYCPEALSTAADAAIRASEEPAVSLLTEVELCSALAAKARMRELAPRSAQRIISRFRLDLEEGRYRIVPIEAKEYALACDWIGRFSAPLRTVDALHLAAAFSSGSCLLTADKALARSAARFGVEHELIS